MKKTYHIVLLVMAAGWFASCSNDATGVDELISTKTAGNASSDLTRNFPSDNGAEELKGSEAEKLWKILQGADEEFPRKQARYEITPAQYEEIKDFTDKLVEGKTTDTQKYSAIWSWIRTNIKPNYEHDPKYGNEPYDVFINKKCVCQGYANLMSVMALSQGIEVINVNGYKDREGHAWNYVRHGGEWWLSDPTQGLEYKAANVSSYKNSYVPLSADGNFLETAEYAYSFVDAAVNLNVVKEADYAMVVPFSVTLNNGSCYKVTHFSPSEPLPENVREIYIGSNIVSLSTSELVGLKNNAPNVEAVYVDPTNKTLYSYAGVVYSWNMEEPIYIPAAMTTIELMPLEVIGKNYIYNHKGIEEVVIAGGTKRIEAWAVEKCPNLKVAYVPIDTEVDDKAFYSVHPDFHIVRQDPTTGIKDVWAN